MNTADFDSRGWSNHPDLTYPLDRAIIVKERAYLELQKLRHVRVELDDLKALQNKGHILIDQICIQIDEADVERSLKARIAMAGLNLIASTKLLIEANQHSLPILQIPLQEEFEELNLFLLKSKGNPLITAILDIFIDNNRTIPFCND